MVGIELILKYFPNLTQTQKQQFEGLYPLYKEWNEKINVISRKDIEDLYLKHVLHSLSIASFIKFKDVHNILDIGTGGGFPGIPLAILYPEIEFHLVDSIGKKILVVSEVAKGIELKNVKAEHARAEQIRGKYDVVTGRAVTQLLDFYSWIHKNLKPDSDVICLKGGDLDDEIRTFKQANHRSEVKTFEIFNKIPEPFFETKKIVLVTKA